MLDPSRKVQPADWMISLPTMEVMQTLNRHEEDVAALFVGGCVRNLLMGESVKDIDIATSLTPERVQKKLETAGIQVVPTGIEHGTVTAVINANHYEITTLRKDVNTDGRHADVEFTSDWIEDAKRRDFTINTLLADTQGQIYDLLAMGLRDIADRRILFVGDPEERIKEDYLRILRFFRFHALYGRNDPDPIALRACQKYASSITSLSKERIVHEYSKILSADDPGDILMEMMKYDVLKQVIHRRCDRGVLSKLCVLQEQNDEFNLMARFVVLGNIEIQHLEAFEEYMVFSNRQKDEYKSIVNTYNAQGALSEKQIKELLYRTSKDVFMQASFIHGAQGNIDDDYLAFILHLVKRWSPPKFPVSGSDVMDYGIEQGPKIGAVLDHLEEWWIAEGFKPSRESCLDEMKKHLSELKNKG